MDTIVVYTPNISPRFTYVADWLFRERLQLNYRVTQDENELEQLGFYISYGKVTRNSISIPDTGLLFETGFRQLKPQQDQWGNLPTFFSYRNGDYTLPFDIFSAIFFLLSRQEEYCPFTADKHDRFPATESILYKNGLIKRPIVDEWVFAFRSLISKHIDSSLAEINYSFQPSYDIDMAFSHLHKGIKRIAGAYVRAILEGDITIINERIRVLKKKQADPYDSFHWLHELHKNDKVRPLYFILSALKTTAFDKNIHPHHPAMVRVIKQLSKEGPIGIHPSYYSNKVEIISREKDTLEKLGHSTIKISRQHYIKFTIPETFRVLQKIGISDDYSMGYGTHLGFRAGTGSSFLWYDLENESITSLRIHPFCFMDTTAHYEEKLSVNESFNCLKEMSNKLMDTKSNLTIIFHNFSLGTAREWAGWREAYRDFIAN